jgi:nucleotide-binding universal stress UspA family protein
LIEAELTLFYVQSLFELTPQELIAGKSKVIESIAAQLEEQCQEVRKAFKISCYADVEPTSGSLASAINLKASDYDLIVMGTNGANDLYQFFFGSNAYNVIKKSSLPVLLVPPDCTFSSIERTVYAFDYLREGEPPMHQLNLWLKEWQSNLTVLQVMEEAQSGKADLDVQARQKLIQSRYQGEAVLNFDTVHAENAILAINSYMLRNGADMLALCAVHHGLIEHIFHKSVIKAISSIGQYPIFVFHG